MSSRHLEITDELVDYVRRVSVRETPLQRRLREETASLPNSRMQITPEQGQFMGLLMRLMGARRTLEIGVFTGYSSLAVALALPEDGRIVACDASREWTSIARRYWTEAGVAKKVDLRLGPAMETLDALLAQGEAGKYDFAFIDADKTNYQGYYERALVLLRRGGLIAIDNVLWHGSVVDSKVTDEETEAIRQLNEAIRKDDRVDLSMLTIGDGLTLAVKR